MLCISQREFPALPTNHPGDSDTFLKSHPQDYDYGIQTYGAVLTSDIKNKEIPILWGRGIEENLMQRCK